MTEKDKLEWTKKLIKNMKCSPLQARCVVESTDHMTERYKDEIAEKEFLLFMSLAGNVLSQSMDKETLKGFFNEVFGLYSCVNKDLLDWEEVIALNEEYADVKIETKYLNLIEHSAESVVSYEGKNWVKRYINRDKIDESIAKSMEYAKSLKDAADKGDSDKVQARAEGIVMGVEYLRNNIMEVISDSKEN